MSRSAKRVERVTIDGQEISLTNLDKVLYPATGFTKGDVITYARGIAPVLLPHLKGRPLSLKRSPDGVDGEAFFQKNCPPKRPRWIRTIPLGETRSGREVDVCSVESEAGLVWLANLAALELHAYLWTAAARDTPTMMVFDLDPGPGTSLVDCARLALRLRGALGAAGLESLAKTSGGKGIHIAVPLNTPGITFDRTKALARDVAGMLEREEPGKVTTSMSKAVRPGRVFIDWSQNDRHKTTVSVYSLRGRGRPTVSTPVAWKEVAAAVRAGDPSELVFEAPAVLRRVERLGDLAEPLLKLRQRLPGPARAGLPGRAAAGPKRGPAAEAGPRKPARAADRRG
jgi:bifunctional non-homologous end joining protein LigD